MKEKKLKLLKVPQPAQKADEEAVIHQTGCLDARMALLRHPENIAKPCRKKRI